MRKFLIIAAAFFMTLGIIFTIFPLGTIAFIPLGIAFVFSVLAIQKTRNTSKNLPKIILFIVAVTFLVVIGKVVFIKDVVVQDKQFEKNKIEQKKEDINDLEKM